MAGLFAQEGFPTKGWWCHYVDDLGAVEAVCVACGTQPIRYAHVLVHDAYAEEIRVGCVCAEVLTNDYVNPKRRQREAQKQAERRKRQKQAAFKKGWQQTVEAGRLFYRQAGYTVSQAWHGSDQFRIRQPEGVFAPITLPLDDALDAVMKKVVGV